MSAIRLAIHGAMLADHRRNEAFSRAVSACVQPGDVVIDVGAGTGLLSMLAARAGARKVYALESTAMATIAARLIDCNGLAEIVSVEASHSSRWSPPEHADVILCETLGVAVFEEGFRAALVDARERMLKPGGQLIPQGLTLYAVPVTEVPHLPNLRSLDHLLGLDFSPLARVLGGVYQRTYVPRENELAEPAKLWEIDCAAMRSSDILETKVHFRVNRRGILAGFIMWFDADLGAGIHVNNRWPDYENHWGQVFMAARERQTVEEGAEIAFTMKIEDSPDTFRMHWSEAE